jgi:hypothetical protein
MRLRTLAVLFAAGLVAVGVAVAGINGNWSDHANGAQEVPPRDTQGQAQAIFHLSSDGSALEYKLIASNIDNVFMAHIHCGPLGVNGPVVVWLYPSTTPGAGPTGGGRHDGILAEGTFSGTNVIALAPGANPACPSGIASLADVLTKINEHEAYVNVHTSDGDDTPNEGPGDFPGGEIRGQLDK